MPSHPTDHLAFGPADGAVFQFAHRVADLDTAMADFTARLGVGPWFLSGPFNPPNSLYRGEPCLFELSIAFGFIDQVQIELIQQHNDAPSTLMERPMGFHHYGIGVRDFDTALERGVAVGDPVIFTDVTPTKGRVAILDTGRSLPGMVELIEMNDALEDRFARMQRASVNWDGTDPVRRGGPR